GKKRAISDLNISVEGGTIVGLLGPNGAGKSTTFLCAAGLLRPDSGDFFWARQKLGRDRGRTVALIPETPDVFPMLTVWEHLEFVAKSCRLADGWQANADALLARFGIAEQRDKLGKDLSKGMRQKTLVAATVLADTPVLLFDEPNVGLDPLGQRELRDIVRTLRDQGKAIIISTHMVEQAESLCNSVVILKNGREIASGTFEALHARAADATNAEDVFLELTR
ncbi:MAG: ABC transporter ATP-binding protein, partial [Candidatus Eremiobacteraeota bacterium]|nr:ABC transporter ATP-binding protein [Candidatus Eremiobacteraeota bacterium]